MGAEGIELSGIRLEICGGPQAARIEAILLKWHVAQFRSANSAWVLSRTLQICSIQNFQGIY